MSSRIFNISVDCARPYELAQFWSGVLDRSIHPDNEPADVEVGIPLDAGGELLFQAVPEPKSGKNRLHLCLEPEQARDLEVARLLDLGAALHNDLRTPDGKGWAVLTDPEGNEFCVLRSRVEREQPQLG